MNDDDVIFTLEMENCLKINLIKWINRRSQMDYLMSKMNTATKSDKDMLKMLQRWIIYQESENSQNCTKYKELNVHGK